MKKLVIGNWKLNNNLLETTEFFNNDNLTKFRELKNVNFGIAPNFCFIPKVLSPFIKVSQNISVYEKGAYTGETSGSMLKSIDTKMCIVGHSERRIYFKETDQELNIKISNCLKNELIPILCIGESLQEFDKNMTLQVITNQLNSALKDIDPSKIIIAYEPIWAIGTNKIPTILHIAKVTNLIRSLTSKDTIIQYGGSVNETNIKTFLELKNVNGFLVGGASLNVDKFYTLLKIINDYE
ncbi:MAG: triose-phosphate isomerase [Mycoplasma sp.]|nr:triose-phosphate isomerase [Mycoplasma sp.]